MSFLAKLFRRSSASTNTKENSNSNSTANVSNSTANVSSSRSSLSYQSRAPRSQISTSDDENIVSKINWTNSSAPAPRVGTNGVWINVILDESGSMRRVADDTIASFNNYINKQKEVRVKVPEEELVEGAASSSTSSSSSSSASPRVQGSTSPSPSAPSVEANETKEDLAAEEKASCFVSLTKFDAPKIKDVYNRTLLAEVPTLSHDTYKPAGGTNLLDAMGHVIGKVDNFLTAIESVTDRPSVLVVILTDGQENMSRTYNRETIKSLVESRTAAGWMFVFLGANIDAWGTAAQYGINKSNAFNFSVDRQHDVMDALNESTEQWRNVSKAGQMRFKKAVSERPESCEAEVNAYAAKQSSYSFFSSDVRARKESRK